MGQLLNAVLGIDAAARIAAQALGARSEPGKALQTAVIALRRELAPSTPRKP